MKNRKKTLIVLIISLNCFWLHSYSQLNVKDSTLSAGMFSITYAYQIPGGDLVDRFGNNSNIGGSFMWKTHTNWIIGADFNFFFSSNIKHKDDILKNILTSNGYLIDNQGAFTDIFLYERGFYTTLKFGKVFSVFGSNPNSGITLIGGVGLLQHKIRIEGADPQNEPPQISGDYKKGYDKLSNGLCISEFIGYMNLGSNKITNFYIGVEFIQSWTQSRRDYDFNLMGKDETKRLDILSGIKIGWTIPFYRQSGDKYYFY